MARRFRRRALFAGGFALLAASGIAVAVWAAVPRGQPAPPSYVRPTSPYPEVVATVNGEPIGGLALAQVEQAFEEQAKRQPQDLPLPQQDPLDFLIDQHLMLQAADRLGLTPTRQEVEAYARMWEARLNDLPLEQRLEFETLMAAQGLPTEDFTDNETLMAAYEQSLKLVKLREYMRQQVAQEQRIPVDRVTPAQVAEAMEAFLAAERAKADIVVLLR